jgi:hypothetical protein
MKTRVRNTWQSDREWGKSIGQARTGHGVANQTRWILGNISASWIWRKFERLFWREYQDCNLVVASQVVTFYSAQVLIICSKLLLLEVFSVAFNTYRERILVERQSWRCTDLPMLVTTFSNQGISQYEHAQKLESASYHAFDGSFQWVSWYSSTTRA